MMDRIFNYVFKTTQERLHGFLFTFLKKYYGEANLFYGDKFLLARGEIPVALVAHLDTVHRQSNKDCLYYDPKNNVAWSPKGLGADDRAGVYSIIEIVKRGYRPSIIFTHDEETGAGGAREVTKYNLPFVPNFMIELDRRGFKEAVFYDCGNKDFQQKILSYGFRLGHGSFSDISVLAPVYDIAAVNLGIGYYNEHTTQEYLDLNEMFDTVNRVCTILKDEKDSTKTYDFQKIEYKSYNYNTVYNYNDSYNSYNYGSRTNGYNKTKTQIQQELEEENEYWNAYFEKKRGVGTVVEIDGGSKKNELEEEVEKQVSEMQLEDFNPADMNKWTQAELDRYYDLLYADNVNAIDWYARYYDLTEQGNEFNGLDIVSDDPEVVNRFLRTEAH